jgi:NAD(P)-dependent dehydrogenase (short-subunit alcohol dehydrogenase family)
MISFTGQDLLFIGGSSGIGFAAARLAAEAGAAVTIASRSSERVAAAVAKLGGGAKGRMLDVTDDAAVEQFFADGAVWDHVVVTGSEVHMNAVRQQTMEAAYAAVDSKFWGFYRVARTANIRAGGSLSVVAGFLSHRPVAGRALMGAINAGLESLVQGLALELKPVRVNVVSPAVVRTEMWAGMSAEARDTMYATLAAGYPAGKVGDPEEVARMLLLLAATGYATGTVVVMDGGASIA